jgi:hypothetical protein
MVAVTSYDELARTPPPVTLTPTPPGKWRWAGSQTAIFDPEKRFPKATEYTVVVPAGTRAANGQALAQAERWTFTTPAPTLVNSYPKNGPHGLDPVMYAELDQAIDAAAVLRMIEVRDGGTNIDVRAATEDEIEADPVVRRLVDKAQKDRFVAFKATKGLAPGMNVEVFFPAGLPSAEGPRRTDAALGFHFYTYRPLSVLRSRCGWGLCPPGGAWQIVFDNPLDARKLDRSWVRVSPELPAMKMGVAGDILQITPRSRGKTRYTVTLSGAIADTFGQTLGKDVKVEIAVDRAQPVLFGEENEMSVLDPRGGPVLPVFTVNRPALNVRIYAVGPGDWERYRKWRQDWDEEAKNTAPPGPNDDRLPAFTARLERRNHAGAQER